MIKRIVNNESGEISLLLPEDLKDKILEVYINPREGSNDPKDENDEIEQVKFIN